MFHIVNDIMTQRSQEYTTKMLSAIGKLELLARKLIKTKMSPMVNPDRQQFCDQSIRELQNANLPKLITDLKSAVDEVRTDMDSYYETFMCVLCDGKNHAFFEINKTIKSSKVTLNAEFC